MKASTFFPLFLIAMALGRCALAQQSLGYQMKQHDLNAGGCPKGGLSLASPHYEIRVGSIGDGLAVTGMGSPAYRVAAGFPSNTATSAATCILDCLAEAPTQGTVAQTLTFQATATAVGCTGTPAFAWAFGDGGTSSEQGSTHAYAAAGTYSWTLTVTADNQICTKTGSVVITATPTCTLVCGSTVPAEGKAGHPVAFQATATATDCTGAPAYVWTFGDGKTSSEQDPSHTYTSAGTYTWSLVVSADDQTCTKGAGIQIASSIPGDCDGTGEVSIGEVQKAINMFLGTIPPDCGVDCDGSGEVSIGEVQKVINAFLGLSTSC
jgi:hypothetical protein